MTKIIKKALEGRKNADKKDSEEVEQVEQDFQIRHISEGFLINFVMKNRIQKFFNVVRESESDTILKK